MTWLMVGHRGTGKSTLGASLDSDLQVVDLDDCLEKRWGPLSEIFLHQGERVFRQLEKEELKAQLSLSPDLIVLGAGCEIPSGYPVLWVRRDSDLRGRSFLDRPRLDGKSRPLKEFQDRFVKREKIFSERADEVLTLREGGSSKSDASFFNDTLQMKGACLSLPRMAFESEAYLKRRSRWSFSFWEWRDDQGLPSPARYKDLFAKTPLIVSSRRRSRSRPLDSALSFADHWDWDLALGAVPKDATIVSSHEWSRVPSDSGRRHLKWAPEVGSWEQLMRGHHWWREDPRNRSFLPRDPHSGRWKWYRLIHKNKMLLNFVRESSSEVMDQPSVLEWSETPSDVQGFGAVLGQDVLTSWSPWFHSNFCADRSWAFVPIPMDLEEFRETRLQWLQELGLKVASVTSPLKQKASELCSQSGPINTLAWNEKWVGCDTDTPALMEVLKTLIHKNIAIWGSGALGQRLLKSLPRAQLFSVRKSLSGSREHALLNFDVLVWAAGWASSAEDCPVRAPLVVDLDYKENSPAREFAVIHDLAYVSGNELFTRQASSQQQFWSSL